MIIERVMEMGSNYVKVPFYQATSQGMNEKPILSEYEYTLLENTKIPGIAKVSKHLEAGKENLLYSITSYMSLEEKMQRCELNEDMFLDFFKQLTKVFENISSYLLDFEALNLNPRYIFFDEEKKSYIFLMGNVDECTIKENFEKLFTFFADICPIGQQELLEFIFELFGNLSEENFEVYSFIKHIAEHQFEDPLEEEMDVFMFDEETDISELSEKEFEKKKKLSIYFICICSLVLAVIFGYFVEYEFKYCIVSMALSLLATGFMLYMVVKTVRCEMKSKSI